MGDGGDVVWGVLDRVDRLRRSVGRHDAELQAGRARVDDEDPQFSSGYHATGESDNRQRRATLDPSLVRVIVPTKVKVRRLLSGLCLRSLSEEAFQMWSRRHPRRRSLLVVCSCAAVALAAPSVSRSDVDPGPVPVPIPLPVTLPPPLDAG